MNEMEQAENRVKQVEAEYGSNHQYLADALLDYAKVLRQAYWLQEAEEMEAKAKAISGAHSFGDASAVEVAPPATIEKATKNKAIAQNENTKACQYCAETIKSDAIKCKHCGSNLTQKSKKLNPLKLALIAVGALVLVGMAGILLPILQNEQECARVAQRFPVGSVFTVANSSDNCLLLFDRPEYLLEYLHDRSIGDKIALDHLFLHGYSMLGDDANVRILDNQCEGVLRGKLIQVRVEETNDFEKGKAFWVVTDQMERKAKRKSE